MEIANELTELRSLKNKLQKPQILSKKELEKILKRFPNEQNNSSIQQIIEQLHELGFILIFQGLEYYILDPQWLSIVFRTVVSLHNSIENGMIKRSEILSNLSKLIHIDFKTKDSSYKISSIRISGNDEDKTKVEEEENEKDKNISE